MLAPTGVAAININVTTIHSGLNMSCGSKLMPLSDKNHVELRDKNSEVQIVIIDEISMMSGKLLFQIHKRLNEIFSQQQDIPLVESRSCLWRLVSASSSSSKTSIYA